MWRYPAWRRSNGFPVKSIPEVQQGKPGVDISTQLQKTSRKISTLNAKPLHEALKQWYAQSNDRFEVSVDGFVVEYR
jgi:hypothetical protein